MAEPPVEDGAVKLSVTIPFPGVAERDVGAPGTVTGVTDTESDTAPCPTAFTARNRNR